MERPNVVIVNCDDLGYGDLGCYGSDQHDTPHLDRMAAEGVRFTDFLMASPVCSPSRASLLTGSHPLRIGFGGEGAGGLGGVLFPGWPIGLHPDEVTIAGALRHAGYATLAVGKWHCGDQPDFLPTNHGFDEWYGIPYSNDMGRQVEPPDGPSDAELEDLVRQMGVTMPWIRPPLPLMEGTDVIEQQPDQASLTSRYVERCVRFVRANRDRPFFLYLAHLYVHLPIYAPDRFLASSRNGHYGGAVAAIDWASGVLLRELARLGLDERTIVVFTSDNGALDEQRGGAGSNRPLRGAKGTTWEGGQRVPCIVRWPGHVPAGVEVRDMATSLDLLPTLAELCGASLPTDRLVDGDSITGLLGVGDSHPDPERSFAYALDGSLEAVRAGRWKLHARKRNRELEELYDLGSDPGETTDVAADHPDVVARLHAELDRWRADVGDEATGTVGAGVRPIGRVDDPVPLTAFDPDHPYFAAEYDLPHRG
ncbi:MAG: sulfatase [Acidimicrobiia bacterium]